MTLNEVIEVLLEIKKEYGDLPVYRTYRDERGMDEEEVDESDFDVRKSSVISSFPLRLTIMDW
jgi:hypothetical protein